MIRSMTGYGKSESVSEGHYFKFEIKSVNHRYLDISIRLPRQLLFMEETFKQMISERVGRGKIEVYVTYECYSEGNYEVTIDRNLAKIYKEAYESLGEFLNIQQDLTVSGIVGTKDVIVLRAVEEDPEKLLEPARKVLGEALDQFIRMKILEGGKLAKDMALKNEEIARLLSEIENVAPTVPLEYREKLMRRLEEYLKNDTLDESRIMAEVALFADKCCIDEEVTRLKSHIGQLRDLLAKDGSEGKKMDFLLQEMNREINTIGSKANNLDITKCVVEMKSELEKIREQIQNIE